VRTAEEVHNELVDRLIARGSLWSPALIAAFRATPRHLFLDQVYHHHSGGWRTLAPEQLSEDDLRLIASDRALTTHLSDAGPGEQAVAISSSSQPSLMAQMLEDLRLSPGQRILEIGAGTGYNAALLAFVVGSGEPGVLTPGEGTIGDVISIDVDREVLDSASRHLSALPDRCVELYHADGRLGFPSAAPFDRIQVTAATPDMEPAWLEQLVPGGLVQAPVDLAPGLAYVMQGEVHDGILTGGLTRPAYFMPLRDEGAAGRDRNAPEAPLPGPERFQAVPAPWARWNERRTASEIDDFLPALAMLAWLEGLSLGYANCPDGRPGHAVVDLVRGQACWLGPHEWRISGKGGHEMGLRLWRQWLDLGGPRPEEWRLSAAADGARLVMRAEARAAYRRQGARCAQVWELIGPRERRMG
jgi:protein-L-isoaspartate(D-aspartate) O-methyltransferase